MEAEATIGYGFLVDPETINNKAVARAAMEIDSVKEDTSRYFDTYEGELTAKYPSDLLREVALSHPDFDKFFSVSRTGDQSGFADETMILITARSTTQTAYVCGRILPTSEATEEERQALSIFKERYIVTSEDEDGLYWALAASCD